LASVLPLPAGRGWLGPGADASGSWFTPSLTLGARCGGGPTRSRMALVARRISLHEAALVGVWWAR
jgi:hypothetical protein